MLERIEVELHGLVVDEAGEAVSEAIVFVVGYEEESATTGPAGQFLLNAHAAAGERVRL